MERRSDMEQMNKIKQNLESNEMERIDGSLITKELVKSLITFILIAFLVNGITYIIMRSIEREDGVNFPPVAWYIFWGVFLAIWLIPTILNVIYFIIYVDYFHYTISDKFIIIYSGVLTKKRATIPFSRIQNISIVQGIFDRIFKLYTVKIETAGFSAAASSGGSNIKPEGYIPAVRDPSNLENIIHSLVHKYTQTPAELKGKVFDNPDIAFDQFASYFLEKINGGGNMKNNLKQLRNRKNLTQVQLAEKVGVTRTTIYYLEAGKYLPSLKLAMLLSEVLEVDIQKIFQLEDNDRKEKEII